MNLETEVAISLGYEGSNPSMNVVYPVDKGEPYGICTNYEIYAFKPEKIGLSIDAKPCITCFAWPEEENE